MSLFYRIKLLFSNRFFLNNIIVGQERHVQTEMTRNEAYEIVNMRKIIAVKKNAAYTVHNVLKPTTLHTLQ